MAEQKKVIIDSNYVDINKLIVQCHFLYAMNFLNVFNCLYHSFIQLGLLKTIIIFSHLLKT